MLTFRTVAAFYLWYYIYYDWWRHTVKALKKLTQTLLFMFLLACFILIILYSESRQSKCIKRDSCRHLSSITAHCMKHWVIHIRLCRLMIAIRQLKGLSWLYITSIRIVYSHQTSFYLHLETLGFWGNRDMYLLPSKRFCHSKSCIITHKNVHYH